MKPTTIYGKCVPGALAQSHARVQRAQGSAHVPQRHQRRARPGIVASNSRVYVEAPPAPQGSSSAGQASGQRHVLHIDMDRDGALVLASLLAPEAQVTHAATVAEARRQLQERLFSLVVLDPAMPDADARSLLPLLTGTPLLMYSALQPQWSDVQATYLPKPWTTPRQLWVAISSLLGVSASLAAGD